ncbi:ABC transporter permease [Zafaria cholistanensis]|uniref:ABC transporter permease n=1 Tax=Zafaria cholistanensis TaxID=1682741 RepID=A0A5A7NRL1_9MICC|nr:ABC transporter permease [Zafaria cholistanensis]GER22752.1 ABC transporter permease [Zafaria cholistanensis]
MLPNSGAPHRAGSRGGLLASELALVFRRRRTWAMLLALGAVPVLIALAVRLTSGPPAGRGPAFLDRVAGNGLFVALVGMLVSIPLFLPLTVAVVAGDTIAGEAGNGTLRYLLLAPASRARLLLIKYAAAAAFCVAATAMVALCGVGIGLLLFPAGPVALLSGDTIPLGESFLRLGLVTAYAAVSLLGLAAVGLFVSTLTDVPVGAMAATAVLSVAAQIMGQLPQLDWLHPWLFTEHWMGFADLLRQPVLWDSFGENAALQAGYVLLFGGLAWARFATKDILS